MFFPSLRPWVFTFYKMEMNTGMEMDINDSGREVAGYSFLAAVLTDRTEQVPVPVPVAVPTSVQLPATYLLPKTVVNSEPQVAPVHVPVVVPIVGGTRSVLENGSQRSYADAATETITEDEVTPRVTNGRLQGINMTCTPGWPMYVVPKVVPVQHYIEKVVRVPYPITRPTTLVGPEVVPHDTVTVIREAVARAEEDVRQTTGGAALMGPQVEQVNSQRCKPIEINVRVLGGKGENHAFRPSGKGFDRPRRGRGGQGRFHPYKKTSFPLQFNSIQTKSSLFFVLNI